jgi:hypothetical protein
LTPRISLKIKRREAEFKSKRLEATVGQKVCKIPSKWKKSGHGSESVIPVMALKLRLPFRLAWAEKDTRSPKWSKKVSNNKEPA